MKYLLDTNICVFVIRNKSPQVIQRVQQYQRSDLGISTMTLAELRYGADKSKNPVGNHAALDNFLPSLEVERFTEDAARSYGMIRVDLERRGLPISPLDTLIAAHALSLGVILVTNNTSEFSRVSGLTIEDWTIP